MRITEENVVSELRKHNEKALYYVIDQYSGLIKSIIRKHLHQQDVHEECMDDILLSIWNHAESFSADKNSFKNWLAAISKYKAIDYERKYYREKSKAQYISSEVEQASRGYEQDSLDDLRSELEEMLGSLEEKDREIFMNHYIHEQSIGKIASDLGVKHSWVYNRLSRGRKKLKALYKGLREQ
ncbi:sigma-70 family RNA polymerase sigma factor [Paenibacillus sp. HJL G12]|uniref:Sigma-70 family RNA polymerase sigma factor n=1 Tax=Paenibacillus dendrobii TaxID=2691084 RepID=A0A7X3IFM8_9BACL|nr:sigma-70 family RNA polymerase sigma factor [Paenibacillus dendrobii]MWV43029.1 sigma-70 family RNA polymerase sigma factor [Paenibacillus dendrobii]